MSFDPSAFQRFATVAVHGGLTPDPGTGAIVTPLFQTATYVQDAVGQDRGFTYTRSGNPTVAALERHLGALEEAPAAICFSTGMAAVSALCLSELKAGDHVVCGDAVYGGTVRLLRQILPRFGVETTFVDPADPAAFAAALGPRTRLALVESPANPTLRLADIAGIAHHTRSRRIPLCVDNTFLTAALQQPLALGADLSLYSTTKYVEGHNATVGGAIVSRDPALLERLRFVCNAVGIPLSPFDAWLTLRGSKTLALRMKAHSDNALRIASFLEDHPSVLRVAHPDLDSFPQRDLARRQQKAGGGTLAFELRGGLEAGVRLMNRLKLAALAESLGAVETLVTHPASMTHASVPAEQRHAVGLSDGLVRLSVGLEDPADLIADLEQALSA